jgi:hypothetical protein
MADFKTDESYFNMAIAYLIRIDKILTACWYCSYRKDIDGWQKNLRALYREICVKMNPAEEKDLLGNMNDPPIENFKYITTAQVNFTNLNRLINDPEKSVTNRREILYLLDQLEVKLRKHCQTKGMLLPGKSDPNFAVLER